MWYFSYVSRRIFGLNRCAGDKSPLIFESHDGTGPIYSDRFLKKMRSSKIVRTYGNRFRLKRSLSCAETLCGDRGLYGKQPDGSSMDIKKPVFQSTVVRSFSPDFWRKQWVANSSERIEAYFDWSVRYWTPKRCVDRGVIRRIIRWFLIYCRPIFSPGFRRNVFFRNVYLTLW